jgi:NADPH2 dehydrogenase
MPSIHDSITVRGMQCRNRLVMAPMVTGFAEDGVVTNRMVEWYARQARAGLGLIVVESAAIVADGALVPRQLGVWTESHVAGLSRLVAAIHASGVPAILQVVHGGARAFRTDPAEERLGPSAVRLLPGPAPRSLTVSEIRALTASFAAAARRAVAAGFDGVEIHAAHYYLLSEFLSPYANRRDDVYGGDLERRARFALDVVEATRRELGDNRVLAVRMHCVERVEGGLSTADAIATAGLLERAGVDLLDASAIGQSVIQHDSDGEYLSTGSVLPKDAEPGANLPFAAKLKRALGIPLIAVGKIGDGALAQKALDDGSTDLVAIGRQLIADPDAGRKILAGRDDEIIRCKQCLVCFASIRKGPINCSVNRALKTVST